jgi:UDP-N-acetylmuramoyl-L-alanyl-D-glutamate--2,6-diaminopimelate ligase
MLDNTLSNIRKLIPEKIFALFQPTYHWILSFLAALLYRFPSKKIKVIAVTGTKGKSSTVELINAMLEEAGYKTALSNTIRFKVGEKSMANLYKMSMPGRFFAQKLIRKAVNQNCDYMIMEMTSQGALLYRHRFIELNVLVFTNLTPEHIEAHGSYENYLNSKLSVAKNMERSQKIEKTIIANADDKESRRFLECTANKKIAYSIHSVEPYKINKEGLDFTLNGHPVHSHLSGLFNLYNIIASIEVAKDQNIPTEKIERALEKFMGIPGRVQKINANLSTISTTNKANKQDFTVIVDYAHTPDSLEKLYQLFNTSRKICVLGGTGGGRDTWKRSEMGKIADKYCSEIILTNEDPYDENPEQIIGHVAQGIKNHTYTTILDRRMAISEAINRAQTGDTVLITGKGTDPYIMGSKNSKTPWSDAKVAEEELQKILANR